MSSTTASQPEIAPLVARIAGWDEAAITAEFNANGEYIQLTDILPPALLATLTASLPALEAHVHRNFIPGHKKGGSISRYALDAHAPAFAALYREPALRAFLERLCGQPLLYCPPDDVHAYALYYYTEPGDHMGYHYDTSYYKGARYTVLIGLVDESSCKLEYELFHDHPTRAPVPGAISLAPGTLVVFNGDKLWHRITPAAAGDRRIALTLEYVTSHAMHPLRRFVSNMKDAIAYFGFRLVFSGARRR